MSKFGPAGVVCIEWDDAVEHSGWVYDPEAEAQRMDRKRAFSVGILMGETKDNLFICRDVIGATDDNDEYISESVGGVFKIPKGMVIKIHKIKDFGVKFNVPNSAFKTNKAGGRR